MILNGQITISRLHPSNEIHIRLRDGDSGSECIEVKMTPEKFAMALTGMGNVECEIDFREKASVGKIREIKIEMLPRVKAIDPVLRDIEAKKIVEPYEVDGWQAHIKDLFNSNRRVAGTDLNNVTFFRYVEKSTSNNPNSGD